MSQRPLSDTADRAECEGSAPRLQGDPGWGLVALLDPDLDAAVLRLADTVAGRDQRLGFALADNSDRRDRLPSRTSASLTAFARRSDSAML